MITTAGDEPNKKLKLVSTPLQPPVAVLADEYYASVELIEAYVGKVKDKRHIGDVLQEMKTLLPMPKVLNHLKRVRGGQVILALSSELSKDGCLDVVKSRLLEYLEPTVCSCQIPAKPPKTKKQHQEANCYWPCNFHPSKVIEQLLSDSFFTSEEVEKMHRYMRMAIDAAQTHQSAAGAVIVNPKKDAVVAVSFDDRQKNPSQHAVLMAIEKVAAVHRALFRDGRAECEDPLTRSSSSQETRNVAVKDNEDDLPYLCTGYDVFVTREPCCMCAMAMVHSRVKRVFYGCDSTVGALGTKCKLHVNRHLNHHYSVFKGLLSAECKTLEAQVQRG